MRCPYCYNEQPDGSSFCEKCGASLKPAQPQEQNFGNSQQQNPYPSQNPYQQNQQSPFAPPDAQSQGFNPYAPQGQQNQQQPFNPQQQNQQGYNSPYQNQQQGYNPYQQQGQGNFYQPPIQTPAAQPNVGKGASIAALVLGIVSVVCCAYGFIPGILAIIFGAIGMKKKKSIGAPTAMAAVGLILGILSMGWLILLIINGNAIYNQVMDQLNNTLFRLFIIR